MKSENDHISINNLSREITNAEAIMPDADEPTKLENIPLMMADETSKRWVQITRIVGINKVQFTSGSAPRFMFIVELKWSDENVSYISRDHDDFFRYHCWILDTFKKEAGLSNHPRIIPFLPGLYILFSFLMMRFWLRKSANNNVEIKQNICFQHVTTNYLHWSLLRCQS